MSITNPAVCRCPRKPRFTAWFRRDWTCPRCGRAWFSIRRWDGRLVGREWLPAGKGQA